MLIFWGWSDVAHMTEAIDPAIVELGAMAEPVTIKKYPNRRLFNPGTGSYVTLQHLAAMVQADEDFTITETATGEDITESVLKQITVERGRHG